MTTPIDLNQTANLLEISRDEKSRLSSSESPLPARSWGSANSADRFVILVHGLGAHSGWFEAFASRLARTSSYCLAYDQIGFGKRRQESFKSYEQWLDDLRLTFEKLTQEAKGRPVYVMGNSMGAAVVIKTLVRNLIAPAGIVLFSPGFAGYKDTFTVGYRVRALLTALLTPDADVQLPYSLDLVTTDENVKHWLAKDPDMRFAVPARMLLELLKMTIDLPSQCSRVSRPTLMFTAGEDRIVDSVLAKKMFERFPASKQHFDIPGAWHDLMFSEILDEVVSNTFDWMRKTGS